MRLFTASFGPLPIFDVMGNPQKSIEAFATFYTPHIFDRFKMGIKSPPIEKGKKGGGCGTYFECLAWEEGYRCVGGVDEVGRGSLAGPVLAAACTLPKGLRVQGIDDSKRLSPRERALLYRHLTHHPKVDIGIGIIDARYIDATNIAVASLQAMAIAIQQLATPPDFLLIDGNRIPPISIPAKAIIQGDARSQTIGAASIIAKYTRDQIMMQHHSIWPQYGFRHHKGYGTRMHIGALRRYGPSPIHRLSFKPVLLCAPL